MNFGGGDFIQYWSALQLLQSGGNPYDPQQMLMIQQGVDAGRSTPLMMWNPPWLLLILYPLGFLSFETARVVWLMLNLGFLFSAALAIRSYLGLQLTWRTTLLIAAGFFPAFFALSLGQLGILLYLGTTLILLGALKRGALAEGVGLLLLTTKPHLFLLVFVEAAHRACRTRQIKPLLCFAALLVVALTILQQTSAGVTLSWVATLAGVSQSIDLGAVHVSQWMNASPVDTISRALDLDWNAARGLAVFTTAAGVIITWLLLMRRPADAEFDPAAFATIVACSVAIAPFSWGFDYVPLLLASLILLGRLTVSRSLIALYFLIQLGTLILHYTVIEWHHQYFWFLLSMVLFWRVAQLRSKVKFNAPPSRQP